MLADVHPWAYQRHECPGGGKEKQTAQGRGPNGFGRLGYVKLYKQVQSLRTNFAFLNL